MNWLSKFLLAKPRPETAETIKELNDLLAQYQEGRREISAEARTVVKVAGNTVSCIKEVKKGLKNA